jgi:hypothetical protein
MTATKAYSNKDMNGLKVINLGAPANGSNDAARKVDVETAYTAAISRANHTGTQVAATISDFDTQVRTSRLDQMAVPTASVNLNSQKIINLADPTTAQDAATKNYVDTQLAGLTSGQILKGAVRAVSTANVNIASPGTTIDGLTANNGDIFLLAGQTTGTQNGPYVYNGAAAAMTRATNWDTSAEAVLGSYWVVEAGSKADSFALLTNDTAVTIGTTTPAFTYISVAGAAIGRFSATSPAVTAGSAWVVTHNLNSQDVQVRVRRTASPYDFVDVYTEATSVNTVSVIPDLAMASGEYTAIVKY